MDDAMCDEFQNAVDSYNKLKSDQKQMWEDLSITEPHVITEAKPYQDKEHKLRSTMHSTLHGSQSPRGSDMGQSSQGGLTKGSPRRGMSKINLEQRKLLEAEEQAANAAAEKDKAAQEDDTIEVDEKTGQQIFVNELASQLTIQQKL